MRRLLGLYQTVGYFAATSRYRHPRRTHALHRHMPSREGIGVILDWDAASPLPLPMPMALAEFDGSTHLYEHADLRGKAGTRIGAHAGLQLRPHRSAEFPVGQRALLVGQISRRRPARGCGRLHALPRLFEAGRRVDSERIRRAREPGGNRFPQASQRSHLRSSSGRAHDRRGVHRLARRVPADLRGRSGLQSQMEHGLDERYPAVLLSGPDLPQI